MYVCIYVCVCPSTMHRQRYVESYIVEGRQYNKTLSLPAQETIPNLFFFFSGLETGLTPGTRYVDQAGPERCAGTEGVSRHNQPKLFLIASQPKKVSKPSSDL